MKSLRGFVLVLLVILLVSGSRYSLQVEPIFGIDQAASASGQTIPVSEIQKPASDSFFAVEVNSYSHIFSQVYRFPVSSVLANKVVPANFSFRNIFYLPTLIIFNSPVPIFIKGHVLRH